MPRAAPSARPIRIPELGRISVSVSAQGVTGLSFLDFAQAEKIVAGPAGLVGKVLAQVREYGSGKRRSFALPLDLDACTGFTRDVLLATAEIPYGSVLTYGQVAQLIGKPGAARAVGGALGRNPIPLIIPCHRVIGSGNDGGFTGGMAIKYALWRLEGIAPAHRAAHPASRRD